MVSQITQKVKILAIPGLGTGIGQVPPLVCVRQMRIAWEDVVQGKYKTPEEMRSNYACFARRIHETFITTYLKANNTHTSLNLQALSCFYS